MAVNTLGARCRESRIISRCRGVSICTKLTAISLHAREVLQCRRGASKKTLRSIITHKHTPSSVLALESASLTCSTPRCYFSRAWQHGERAALPNSFIIVSALTQASAVNISEGPNLELGGRSRTGNISFTM